jgi:hypothetical protein
MPVLLLQVDLRLQGRIAEVLEVLAGLAIVIQQIMETTLVNVLNMAAAVVKVAVMVEVVVLAYLVLVGVRWVVPMAVVGHGVAILPVVVALYMTMEALEELVLLPQLVELMDVETVVGALLAPVLQEQVMITVIMGAMVERPEVAAGVESPVVVVIPIAVLGAMGPEAK